MIEAQHRETIGAPIDEVWDFVSDIRRWADLFPGCQSCEVLDAHRSRWVIKVGAGGMIKAVTVHVDVRQWSGPEQVLFDYRLESESVTGSGFYNASTAGGGNTEVVLQLAVAGSGQMAPMWEAMCRPLLPQMARSFSGSLRQAIESAAAGTAPAPRPGLLRRLWQWLKSLLH